jgi:protein TonB
LFTYLWQFKAISTRHKAPQEDDMHRIASLFLTISAFVASPAMSADAPGKWQGSVARMIASHQNYPRSAQIRGEEGTSRLRVTLSADGRVDQVELAGSSGSAILDREAQALINGIGKFPAPPAGVKSLFIPIVWRLN